MAAYTPGQLHVIGILRARANAKLGRVDPHARAVIEKAAYETAKVEANYGNPTGGDGTSRGWRQETASSYPGVNRMDVAGAADRFYAEALKAYRPGMKSGDLAAMVQRPAAQYRGRYGQASGEAQSLLKASPSSPASGSGYATTTTPGVDNSASRRQLLAQYLLNEHQPGALTSLVSNLTGAQDTPATTTRTRATGYGQASSPSQGGTAAVDGKRVANWIAPILNYARAHGWTGTVTSGYRSDAEQAKIYQSGVRPAAVPRSLGGKGSNHEFTAYPGGAVDVSNASQLSAILRRSPYASKLVWAGAKDPVHFSHPRGGSY